MKHLRFIVVALALLCSASSFAQADYDYDRPAPYDGYKGMLDFNYALGVGEHSINRFGASTVHGYQINRYVFTGVGVGLNYYYGSESLGLPIFADARFYVPFADNAAFYLDCRIGYSILDEEGLYMSPSLGIRFGRGAAMNLSVGYEFQHCDLIYCGHLSDGTFLYEKDNAGAITFRLGIDF